VGDVSDETKLNWNSFLGMRHIIETLPYSKIPQYEIDIPSDKPTLIVSLNVNATIDQAMRRPFVQDQTAYWSKASASGRVDVIPRDTAAAFLNALRSGTTADQIQYFYCHASAATLDDPDGPDASSLIFGDASLTLGDVKRKAPSMTARLANAPLIFINTC
jgi:hypothetical protein